MTQHERRILYLLRKYGGQRKHSQISQGMARVHRTDRARALASLETLGLISSAKTPAPRGRGGTGGLVYWLTDAGNQAVDDAIAAGEMADPALLDPSTAS